MTKSSYQKLKEDYISLAELYDNCIKDKKLLESKIINWSNTSNDSSFKEFFNIKVVTTNVIE